MKKALITGITGQDGAYLAKFLINKNYEVHGIRRANSMASNFRMNFLFDNSGEFNSKIIFHHGDLTDSNSLINIIQNVMPDEIYNLAAQSDVAISFKEPEYTTNTNAIGTLRILEAIRILNLKDKIKYYQASTSELYGSVREVPQTEKTPFHPRSPYGVSKLFAYWITLNYREAYGLYACNGILFNHESPIRGDDFVTRKISKSLSKIKLGSNEILYLGNLEAKRDWGHAADYVEAQWLMLQQKIPEDFVIATGIQYSVRDFISVASNFLNLKIVWKGNGLNEIGTWNGKDIIKIDSKLFRPAEVDSLIGDASKAKKKLGWTPKVNFENLVKEMVFHDLSLLSKN
jgi:GDPmannose 4,6-dehydratase